jgi:AcrR family transcriptional regulator
MSSDIPSPRDRILSTAGRLFYREGYRAIGIDRVIAEADVAKATFYKHFPSKDDLIVAWIAKADAGSADLLPADNDHLPFFAYADAMIGIAEQPWCMGCTFQATAVEFVDPDHPAHAASLDVKRRVLSRLSALATRQGVLAPDRVATQVYLLIEGVWATVRMFQDPAAIAHARAAVRRLAL